MSGFPAVAGGLAVVHFSEIGSTNAEALRRAAVGGVEQWIVADRQVSGRGRRGRQWVSEPGNLYATLLLYDPAPPVSSAQICFVAALAVHDAICDCVPVFDQTRLRLKWPNDILLDGKKLVGILVEGAMSGTTQAVVVGFGVNCAHHPSDTPYAATALANAGLGVAPAVLFERLSARMLNRLAQWQRGRAFAATRDAWLSRALGLGSEIEVKLPERELSGRFEAIDDEGALVLALSSGHREIIRAGDVFPAISR
jgi:BirA family biotin operon repressor/biotin-[acetyl-CoA-carboxylase] ligase